MAKGLRSWTVVAWGVLGILSFCGTLHWRESDNAAVEQAQQRVQALQAAWRDLAPASSPDGAQRADPARAQQALLAELDAAAQGQQVRDDVLQLLTLRTAGLSWQNMQLDRQGVWQLQLRADRQRALDLWHQHIQTSGLRGLQWVQMTGPAPGTAGADGVLATRTKEALVLTLRAPLGALSGPSPRAGEVL